MASDAELLSVWRNVQVMTTTIRATLADRLAELGEMSLIEHDIMSWLDVVDEVRPRMLDLAELLGISQGGVTRLVDRLVTRGWVVREQQSGNRRYIYARLTGKGRVALRRARAAYLAALREAVPTRLNDGEITHLTALAGQFGARNSRCG
jgi:DNA-binding MarR family transcriptional regulator